MNKDIVIYGSVETMKSSPCTIERKILAIIQEGFPNSRHPYKDMAQKASIETEQLLEVLRKWKKQGRLRRVGAIVNHLKVGFGAGAMVVWQVENGMVEKVGQILAGFKEVSHAYEREVDKNWPYNLYTMVHAKSAEDLEQTVRQMSEACDVADYRILYTKRELKKVPPTYIMP